MDSDKGPQKGDYDTEFYKLSKEANSIAKRQFNIVRDMPQLDPEPDYVVRTRPPIMGEWRLNIVRGMKENKIRTEAGKIAARKWWTHGEAFSDCSLIKGTTRLFTWW